MKTFELQPTHENVLDTFEKDILNRNGRHHSGWQKKYESHGLESLGEKRDPEFSFETILAGSDNPENPECHLL